jgi:peptide deformylase
MTEEYSLRIRGESVLREQCQEVTDFSDLDDLIDGMASVMEGKGIGIAAPQVGDKRQVFITGFGGEVQVYVNPEIVRAEGDVGEKALNETCLSLPEEVVEKKLRYNVVEMRFQDREGNHWTGIFEGVHAIVMQHEYDHLDGVLMTDYQDTKRNYLSDSS